MAEPHASVSAKTLQQVVDANTRPPTSKPSFASIPRTSPARLAQSTPADCPSEPIPSSSVPPPTPGTAPGTVLYLAYGSNLCAETFLGRRAIRPLSQLNVSAPSLRLTFDLPGIPYREPCFANTAPRKIPTDPPKLPPDLPLPLPPDFPPPTLPDRPPWPRPRRWTAAHGDPEWPHGLLGVVYEVTPADYARIVATEGGGASYADILVPCLALPVPRLGVPEQPPPVPEIPRPFLAHTLFAPRLPDVPDDGAGAAAERGDGGVGGLPHPQVPKWARRFLRPAQRPDPEYAQPSARYLQLLIDGAAEHDLPGAYQAWLGELAAYRVTSSRQEVGMWLFVLVALPALSIMTGLSKLLADEKGRLPMWLAVGMGCMFNVLWTVYDYVFKPVFGDGERTEEGNGHEKRWSQDSRGSSDEKRCLLTHARE